MKRAAATTLAVSAAAWSLAHTLPIDAVLLAVLLGMAAARFLPRPWRDAGGLAKASLWVAVALLGAAVTAPGRDIAGPVVALAACAIVVAIAAAWWLRRLGLRAPMALALGIGTGVCGASAIAAARCTGTVRRTTAYGDAIREAPTPRPSHAVPRRAPSWRPVLAVQSQNGVQSLA